MPANHSNTQPPLFATHDPGYGDYDRKGVVNKSLHISHYSLERFQYSLTYV
ncbi:MAG: hypothetical protein C5S38_01165 [Candidatus Methanophagaceae archaeon]|nr:MAG: hypothetical protein C5S38_01165 [Methanophagales archaeon]